MVENKKVSIIMQARMGSERLPGKVLRSICGKSLIGHILTRMEKSKLAKEIIVATTNNETDNAIETECKRYGVKVFRGSESSVLNRFLCAAVRFNTEHIMRFCCDNPFADYGIADNAIKLYNQGNYDYISTKNFPLGVGVEIFPFEILKKAENSANEPYQREHVTPYIIENTTDKSYLTCKRDYSGFRFTIDTEDDWDFTQTVYSHLYSENGYFDYKDVIRLLDEKPEIRKINSFVMQRVSI